MKISIAKKEEKWANGHVCQSNLRFDARAPDSPETVYHFCQSFLEMHFIHFCRLTSKSRCFYWTMGFWALRLLQVGIGPTLPNENMHTQIWHFTRFCQYIYYCVYNNIYFRPCFEQKKSQIGRGISFRQKQIVFGCIALGPHMMMGFIYDICEVKINRSPKWFIAEHAGFIECFSCCFFFVGTILLAILVAILDEIELRFNGTLMCFLEFVSLAFIGKDV